MHRLPFLENELVTYCESTVIAPAQLVGLASLQDGLEGLGPGLEDVRGH
jgi:hypothetical protein